MTVIGKWLDPYMYIHVHVTISKHFQYLLVNEYKKQYRYLVQMVAIAVVRFLLISSVHFCKVSRYFIMSIHVCVCICMRIWSIFANDLKKPCIENQKECYSCSYSCMLNDNDFESWWVTKHFDFLYSLLIYFVCKSL